MKKEKEKGFWDEAKLFGSKAKSVRVLRKLKEELCIAPADTIDD